MSSWRRRAMELLPEQRHYIGMSRSPLELWRHLYSFVIEGCHLTAVNDDMLGRLLGYARQSRNSAALEVRTSVCTEFYEKLFDDEIVRSYLPRHLYETEFLELEQALARRFTSDELREIQKCFYTALQESDNGTTLGAVRHLKDELLITSAPAITDAIRQAWSISLPLLEMREHVLGLEIFIDNVSDLEPPIPHYLNSRLIELLKSTMAQRVVGRLDQVEAS